MVGLSRVITGGWKRITLAVGVEVGVAVGVGLTGHTLAEGVAVGAKGPSPVIGESPLCASAQMGRRRIPESVIRHSRQP
jgi:hypothetical protein